MSESADSRVAAALRETGFDNEIGPRRPGGRYRNGYWNEDYDVLAVRDHPTDQSWMPWSITVRGPDGRIREHCTAWDPKRDRVVYQPD